MSLSREIKNIHSIFIDTAPIIYYIEAHLSTAIHVGADAFLTNDKKLKKIKEIKVMVLSDYL